MLIPGLVGNIQDAMHDIGQDLNIDQAVIDDVMNVLNSNHDDIADSPFTHLHVPASAFGGASTGLELGGHHLKAHQVIKDTLEGVLVDLLAFRDGLKHAERLVQDADTSSAADLDKKRAATEILVTATTHSEGDQRNHEARNHYLGGGHGS